ncbi:MAG: hypothetical protein QOG75_2810, partial [Mycobacterium sp.]|nr:hypothetical protein [Mycobacterium sp.]
MTSPNEPGFPGPGESPNGNGSVDRGGAQRPVNEPAAERVADAGDVTPRKRTGARSVQAQQRQPSEPPKPRETRPAGRAAASPNAEARLSRFISGTAALGAKTPPPDVDPAPARSDSRHNEAYASELPDLSGPIPRAGQRH